MRMMDEMKHMFLYPAKQKVYVPIDERNKRKNSAILLLTPDLNTSINLTKLPYLHNPSLFTSFYVDRDVMTYINTIGQDIEFDEREEESLSEAMLLGWSRKIKFKFDEDMSYMEKKWCSNIFDSNNAMKYTRLLNIGKVPDEIKIIVHPNEGNLRQDAPNNISKLYNKKFYSYSKDNEIHVLSKHVYDEKTMGGPYDLYLTTELIYCLIMMYNKKLDHLVARSIAITSSEQLNWLLDENNKHHIELPKEILTTALNINYLISSNELTPIHKYIHSGNLRNLVNTTKSKQRRSLFEETLSYFDRQRLLPSEFGIPKTRKYPMHDADHVLLAIKMFNNCEHDEEEELAENILKKMKKFDISSVNLSASNRFKKYYDKSDLKNLSESAALNPVFDTFKTPKDIYNWLHQNIRYDNSSNWTLKSPEDLIQTKTGNCHDQAWFIAAALTHLNITSGKLFFIEYNENENAGGRTHSLVYFEENDKFYWIENAWGKQAGVHGPFDTIKDIKNKIEEIHSKEPEAKRYPLIEWGNVHGVKEGMNLQEYLDCCLKDPDSIYESTLLENLDTSILHRSLPNEIKLYHGTNKKLDTIIPNSLNIGTKLSKPRMSSFWAMDKNLALLFAAHQVLQEEFKDADMILPPISKKGELILPLENKSEMINLLKNSKLYVYEKSINKKHIGVGQFHSIGEFTLDTPVKPDKYYTYTYSDIKDSIVFMTNNDIIKLLKDFKKYGTISSDNNPSIMDKMIYHNISDISKIRKELKGLKESPDIMQEDDGPNGIDAVLKICSELSDDEFKKISFNNPYKNSKFIIKRIISKVGDEPAGFLDVYHYPSKPEIAQIVIAVSKNHRDQHLADTMVNELLNDSKITERYNFNNYIWTAHPDNIASMSLAEKHGFINTGIIDGYGRKVFKLSVSEPEIVSEVSKLVSASEDELVSEEGLLMSVNEDSRTEAKYSKNLKKFLYSERIKNNKEVLAIYEQVKSANPYISRTYLKLPMYKQFNLFVDLSYYNSLFLKNSKAKLDKAVNFYFDFINRLTNNEEINREYSKRTIFIPVDSTVWPVQYGTELTDYRKNINPISIIFRLIRSNPSALKNAWRDKDIIFVGSRGYFKVDFNKFELRDLNRFKINLRKLMSVSEEIKDDFEIDELEHVDTDTTKAMAAKIIDKIEKGTNVSIDDISGISKHDDINKSVGENNDERAGQHLRITSSNISISKDTINSDKGVAVIVIDPEGPNGFERITNKSIMYPLKGIKSYCIPK